MKLTTTPIRRRSVVAAAWTAPVVLAASSLPAFASSCQAFGGMLGLEGHNIYAPYKNGDITWTGVNFHNRTPNQSSPYTPMAVTYVITLEWCADQDFSSGVETQSWGLSGNTSLIGYTAFNPVTGDVVIVPQNERKKSGYYRVTVLLTDANGNSAVKYYYIGEMPDVKNWSVPQGEALTEIPSDGCSR